MELRVIPINQINASSVEPIVWNECIGTMIGSHQRYKIMVKELVHTKLQVSVAEVAIFSGY